MDTYFKMCHKIQTIFQKKSKTLIKQQIHVKFIATKYLNHNQTKASNLTDLLFHILFLNFCVASQI